MPIIETIKKGQIKRKTGASSVDILRPETEAEITLYNGTIDGTAVTNVKDAIDALIPGTGIRDVKIQVDSGTATSISSNHIATIPVTSSYVGSGAGSDKIVNGAAIKAAIDTLDVPATGTGAITGFGAGKTLLTLSETNGKVDATFQDINIVSSQVTDIQDTYSGTDGKAISGKGVKAALETLDTSSDVAPASVSGSGASQKITINGIKEVDGIIAGSTAITNAVTYTDGAIDSLLSGKVDKRTSGNEVYTHSGSTQGAIVYDTAATASTIVQRDSNGQIIVPETPTSDTHAASKKYVDTKITAGAEYLGVVNDTTELYALDSSAGNGDWVRTGTEFIYSSETCHVGDILICVTPKGSSAHATWDVLHTEVDTDTNTTYQAIVGAGGTGYAGTVQLQYKNLGDSSWTNQDTIKYINGNGISITPDTTNKTLTIGHSNSISAETTAKIFKTAIDAQGHITSATAATGSDLNALGAVLDTRKVTATGVLSQSSTGALSADVTITHNEVLGTAETTAKVFKTKIDKYGHISEAMAASASDLGIDLVTTTGSEAITVGSESLNLVTRDTTQTISGDKTFSGNVTLGGSSKSVTITDGTSFVPNTTNSIDIGSSSKKFKDLYLAGNLTDGTNAVSVSDLVNNVIHRGTSSSPASAETRYGDLTIIGDVTVGSAIGGINRTFKVYSNAAYPTVLDFNGLAVNKGHGSVTASKLITKGEATNVSYSTYDKTKITYSKWGYVGGVGDYTNYDLSFPEKTGTIAVTDDIPTSIVSGKKSDGSTDITSTLSSGVFTLGNSGITAGTYSALQVNAKGIAIAGGQILDVIANGGTPNVINGGWYFEELAAA